MEPGSQRDFGLGAWRWDQARSEPRQGAAKQSGEIRFRKRPGTSTASEEQCKRQILFARDNQARASTEARAFTSKIAYALSSCA